VVGGSRKDTRRERNCAVTMVSDKKICPICGGLLDKHGCCPKCDICVPEERR